jgi:LPS export ABC transporter protein LptC
LYQKFSFDNNYLKKFKILKITSLSLLIFFILVMFYFPSYKAFINRSSIFLSILNNFISLDLKAPPTLSGTTLSGDKYYITSKSMLIDEKKLGSTERITLLEPYFLLSVKNGKVWQGSSNQALLLKNNKSLYLEDKVRFTSNEADYIDTKKLYIDLSTQEISSTDYIQALYNNISIVAQSYSYIFHNKNQILSLKGPITIINQDKKQNHNGEDSENNLLIKVNDYINLKDVEKIINLKGEIQIIQTIKQRSIYAEKGDIHYKDINAFKGNEDSILENINKITLDENVIFQDKEKNIKTDKYIYNLNKKIMYFISQKNKIKYQDKEHTLDAKKVIEYNEIKAIVTITGSPKLVKKESNIVLNSKTMLAHLTLDKKIKYLELFDSVKILYNNTLVLSDYALYDYENNIIVIENKLNILNPTSQIIACKLIIDTNTKNSEIIPCNNERIEGTYTNENTEETKENTNKDIN